MQTSPIAGRIFASTKLQLRVWFRALYHLTQTKQGISSIELGRRFGVTQTTAWKIEHKLGQVMLERDSAKRLSVRIEVDDADIGARTGRRQARTRRPARIAAFGKQGLDPAGAVVSDGLACFTAVTDAGCSHAIGKTGSGPRAAKTPAFTR